MKYESSDPWDDFGWFAVAVGTEDENGGDNFHCLVTTSRARHRAMAGTRKPRFLVVEPYEPEKIIAAITDRVNEIEGLEWCNIVDQLQAFMHWEYEGMSHVDRMKSPDGRG